MRYIAYYRVSTTRQGESGLGLSAQKEAVSAYLSHTDGELIGEQVEVESGKKNNRPRLECAMDACRKQKATLIIAKLDRLARNVHFISGLMEAGVEFVAVDNPHANRLMLHMLAAFAEHEREQISIRTKAALAAARARGVRLGANGKTLAKENKAAATEFADSIAPIVRDIIEEGHTSLRSIADQLNSKGIRSRAGARWFPASVSRVIQRSKLLQISTTVPTKSTPLKKARSR